MPKKNKQRKQRRSSRTRSKVRPIVYTGKTSFFPTLVAATAQSLSLQPNLLDPGILANLSDTFQLYRCTSLRVKAYPEITSLGNTGVAYINGISDSGPGNIGNSLNMPFNLLIQGTITVPQSFFGSSKLSHQPEFDEVVANSCLNCRDSYNWQLGEHSGTNLVFPSEFNNPR